MAIDTKTFELMVSAGATPDVLLAFVRAQNAAVDAAADARRKRDRERKRAARASANVQRTGVDTQRTGVDVPQPAAPPEPAPTTHSVPPPHPVPEQTSPPPHTQSSLSLFPQERPTEGRKKEGAMRARARPTRLPDDWQPNLDDLAFAKELLPPHIVAREADKFRDYWRARAGPTAVKHDWSAAWRNWCRKELEKSDAQTNRPGPASPDNTIDLRTYAAHIRGQQRAAGSGGP